jgi:16S rRNA processing protein RimM
VASGYAVVGRVRKPHGLHGELVVDLFSDEPEAVFAAGRRLSLGNADAVPGGVDHLVARGRPFKDTWLVTLAGIADRNAAESLRGAHLLVPLDELTPLADDEVFIHDLPGMKVVHVNGTAVGSVDQVTTLPHGLLLEVRTPVGVSSVPFVEPIVVSVDREARTITIDPPEGLLEL